VYSLLEDRQLPLFLLLASFEVQSQDCFVHDAGQKKNLVDLALFRYPAKLVLQGDGDLGVCSIWSGP